MLDEKLDNQIKLTPRFSVERMKKGYQSFRTDLKNDPAMWAIIISVTVFFTIFLVVPLIFVLINSVYYKGQFSFDAYLAVFNSRKHFDPSGSFSVYFFRKVYNPDTGVTSYLIRGPDYGTFLNTMLIGVLTTVVSLIVGIVTAIIMAKMEFSGKTIISGLLLIPLVLPPFVGGIGFFAIAGPEGLLNKYILAKYLHISVQFEGIAAIVLVQSLHYFTLIYLNVYSSMINSDPSMEESAENLGASNLTILRTVTVPLAMPGIASGSILVFILALEDLGTPIIFAGFGDEVAKKTMTYYIMTNFFVSETSNEIEQYSAVLGVWLLFFAVIGFFMIRKYVSLKQYSIVSKGRAGEHRLIPTNIIQKIGIYLYFIVVFVASTLPHLGLLIRSFSSSIQLPPTFKEFIGTVHLHSYLDNFTEGNSAEFSHFIYNTLIYSFIATLVIIIVATFTGYVANRKKFPGQSIFDALVTIPIAIPGIVLGIGYLRMFGDAPVWKIGGIHLTINPLIFPPVLLIISYTVRKFPFTVRSVYAGLQQTDEILEEAAINLGARRLRVLAQIVVPLIAMNIIAGSLVSLVYTMSEVSTTLILVQETKYGNLVWKLKDFNGPISELAALGAFLMFLQAITLLATNLLLKNRADAMTGI